jgi:hypothetical protein
MILYVGSDTLITIDKLRNERTGLYLNSASVHVTVRDSDLEVVTGADRIALEHVADSDGKYQGIIPNTLALTPEATYYLDVTSSEQQLRLDRIRCRAQYATGN